MENQSQKSIDLIDLTQECYSYMKVKQFLANRLSQQQEEIDRLQKTVKYYIAKDVENQALITQLSNQLKYLKKKDRTFSLCSEEALSQDLDELKQDKKKVEMFDEEYGNDEQTNEDLRQEVSKLTVDKYILFNELNEMVMSIKKCNVDQLNSLIMKKQEEFTQGEMPIVGGLHLNVMSAESQLSQIVKVDYKRNVKIFDKDTMEYYERLVKQAEKEFINYIDNKVHKNIKE